MVLGLEMHFVTFSCYRGLPLLGTAGARNVFVHALGQMRERYGFRLVGYVVMPEHVHLLLSEPTKGTPSMVLKALKQVVSRDLRGGGSVTRPGELSLAFSSRGEELPRFWQPRFYDFNVYSSEKKREKLEYMHANPVKRGLVENPAGWIWSSYLFYEMGERGLVEIDPV